MGVPLAPVPASAAAPRTTPVAGSLPAPQATSWAPTAKVAVGTIAGAATILFVEILSKRGIILSAEAGGAITTILTFFIQYWTPERSG